MPEYRLTSRAEADFAEIADYTIATFGVEQARRYFTEFEACLEALAENPRLGRRAERLAPNLRRFEHRAHVIFYVEDQNRVLVVRILHASMDAARHL